AAIYAACVRTSPRELAALQSTVLEDLAMRTSLSSLLALVTIAWVAGCSTEPTTDSRREALITDSRATLTSLEARDPGLRNVVDNSYAYIVFPDVGKGGFGIGGAWGRGVVVEQGRFVGYAAVSE